MLEFIPGKYVHCPADAVEVMIFQINEPFTVKVTIESKIDGDICVQLYEPGVTNAYEVVEGPSEKDQGEPEQVCG